MSQPSWYHRSDDAVADYRAEQPVDLDEVSVLPPPSHATAPEAVPVAGRPAPEPMKDATGQLAQDWVYQPSTAPSPRRQAPPEWGWQARARSLTLGLWSPKPGRVELADRAAAAQIRRTLPGSRLVMVANEKGGAGKTPTSVILAGLLARYRAEQVVAWDINEMRGSLALRSEVQHPSATIVDVLERASVLAQPDAPAAALASYMRRQPQGHLVLASTTDGNAMREMTHDDCHAVLQLLQRRFGIVLADTGNNAAASSWRYTLDAADVLVIPAKPVPSHLEPARKLLAAAVARPQTAQLARSAVLVITSTTGARLSGEEEAWFTDRGITVLHVPGDPVIEADGPIAIDDLTEASVRAWTLVAAAVMRAGEQPSSHDTHAAAHPLRPAGD